MLELTPTMTDPDYDCVIWYYKKILECFDDMYWDNVYLSVNFDPVIGGA